MGLDGLFQVFRFHAGLDRERALCDQFSRIHPGDADTEDAGGARICISLPALVEGGESRMANSDLPLAH